MNRWCHWKDDGAPIRCRSCGELGQEDMVAREFERYAHGFAERGVYHKECADDLWGEGWPARVHYDPKLLKP